MVDNTPAMADRIDQLRSERKLSYRRMADELEVRYGITISAQAIYKWCKKGGNITESNLRMLADFFGESVAYLRYGVEDHDESIAAVVEAMQGMSEQERRMLRDLAQTLKKRSA